MAIIQVSKDPEKKWQNGYFVTTLKGLMQTAEVLIKQFLRIEKTRTLQWPEEEYQYSERFKGAHFLTKRPDGTVRCTACFLCATNCPAECITIVAGENPDKGIEKYPVRFEIDILRCVFCGYCEEACPVDAIRMGPEYSMAGLAEDRWIYTLEYLKDRPVIQNKIGEKQFSRKSENPKHTSVETHVPDVQQAPDNLG